MIAWVRRAVCGLASILVLLAVQGAAAAQEENDPLVALSRLFTAPIEAAWFAPAFLSQVPLPQMEAIVGQLTAAYGPFRQAVRTGDHYTVELARAEVPTLVALDQQGQIAGLLFEAPVSVGGDIDSYVATIAALPGRTAVLVLTNGVRRAAREAETPLAVGSAFKLAVLKAAADQVAAGKLAWDTVVRLDPAWRSLPTGFLQAWPAGTPVTVATLANLMISISDNTATDTLLRTVGREAAEAFAPHSRPLLATREAFALKSREGAALHQAWSAGDEAARRALLDGLAALPLPSVEVLMQNLAPDAEWFFTAEELCGLLAATHTLEPFAIEPGLARREDWQSIAYKGGSEPGVLSLSTYVTDKDGATHCVVATWNGAAPLDDNALVTPYRGLLRALAGSPPG